jgi:hypothetical protein
LVGCCAEFLFSRARPCVCAQRTPIVDSEKFSEVANIALFFNDNNTIAYKGNADLASVTFTQAIFSFTFVKGTGGASGTAPEVVVKGVGFDTTVKYQCAFKLGNSQKVHTTSGGKRLDQAGDAHPAPRMPARWYHDEGCEPRNVQERSLIERTSHIVLRGRVGGCGACSVVPMRVASCACS